MDHQRYEHYRLEVDKGQTPTRIDVYLHQKINDISRSKIQKAAKSDSLLVNEIPVKSNYKVRPNDIIRVMLTFPPKEFEIITENIPVNFEYEDADIVIVNKQAGMVVHPAKGNYSGTLVNALAYHLSDSPLFQKDDIRPGLVHRIDKDTTGLLVVAKTEHAKIHLAKQFFEHTIKRKYQAIVWGNIKPEQGTIIGNIGRNEKNRTVMQVYADGSEGKHAVTHYKVITNYHYVSLIECQLETGRTHQIRIHMKHAGHPLFGDTSYGGDKILKGTTFTKYKQFIHNCFTILPRQALHAKSLGFIHPRTNKKMFFSTDLPEDMTKVIEKWERYVHK